MSKILFFEPQSGISGDMTIGALIDLLDDSKIDEFRKKIMLLNLNDEFDIEIKKESKMGIVGTKFDVLIKHDHHHDHDHSHSHHHNSRNLSDIENIIDNSLLNDKIKSLSKSIFMKVAVAEAKIHGKTIEEVHFHEVGAIDSIVDIVGTAILVDMLEIDDIRCEKVHVGTGFVKCAHGLMPVPAPATQEILIGVPTYSKGIESELVTPTGASILKTLVKDFAKKPDMTVSKVGYGLGTKNLEIANVLRVNIAEVFSNNSFSDTINEELILLETNIDDMSSEVYSYIFDKLFSLNALDVYTTSINMKKNRPGIMLSVLTKEEDVFEIEKFIFKQTTTFGIRKTKVNRTALKREFRKIDTKYGEVTVKLGFLDGEVVKVMPEYEDVKRISLDKNIPFYTVYLDIQSVAIRG